MRAKPPERAGAVFLERFPAVWKRLGFRTHIALRSLARNRMRTASAVVASALATSIILLTMMMYDSMWYLVEFQFDRIAHSDVDIGFRDETSTAALLEGRDLPGVDYAEPVLGMVCDVRNGRRSRRLGITGLSPGHRLTTPIEADGTPIRIPESGLVLSHKLADVLGAEVGDHLELTPVRGRRETVRVPVNSIVESFVGLECYASLNYLSRVVGEGQAVNSVQIAANPAGVTALYRTVKKLPNAQGLAVRADTKANIENTFVSQIGISLAISIAFAGVIAFGTVINVSLVEIQERTRDISTFRVLGYRPGPIAAIFYRQNMVIFVLGLALALPLSYGLLLAMAGAYETELFRMPVLIKPSTVILSASISFVFVVVAQWFVARSIRRLDWLEGMKVKE